MTLIPSTPPKTNTLTQLTLSPNPYRRHLRGFWLYTTGLAIPVLLLHMALSLFSFLSHPVHLILLGGFSVLLFAGITYFRNRQRPTLPQKLLVDPQFIEIRSVGSAVRMDKRELSFHFMGWGPCEEALSPAVRISRSGKTLLTIGALQSDRPWTDLRHSVQATDYLLPEAVEWWAFKAILTETAV